MTQWSDDAFNSAWANCKGSSLNGHVACQLVKAYLSALPPQPVTPVGAGDALTREQLVLALHDVSSQYSPRVSDYLIQRFADRIQREMAKAAMPRAAQGDAKDLCRAGKTSEANEQILGSSSSSEESSGTTRPCAKNNAKVQDALAIIRVRLERIANKTTDDTRNQAEYALTYLATLEEACGGKGE